MEGAVRGLLYLEGALGGRGQAGSPINSLSVSAGALWNRRLIYAGEGLAGFALNAARMLARPQRREAICHRWLWLVR